MIVALQKLIEYLKVKPKKQVTITIEGDSMHFLALVEALSKTINADNIETVVSLVEKLVALAESMKNASSDQQPPVNPPAC